MNDKTKKLTILGIVVIAILLIGATYAFFEATEEGTSSNDVSVTSNTTDNLSFIIENDISFTVSEANFYQGGNNVSGSTTASAILIPNNKTNQATMNYYMYLNLTSNPTVYSTGNTNHDAELILQVFNSNNRLVTLQGLGSQKTVNGITGYDITGRQGLITLLDNHAITANTNPKTENWSVVITLINLNIDQLDNTNKVITGEVILRKNQQLDTLRLAPVVPQTSNDTTKGYVETVIEPSLVTTNNVEEEIYTIYTVGYITDDSISGTTYSIDIQNMGIDFSNYDLELVGTPTVMNTQADYTNYVAMKTSGLPLTTLSNGDINKADATAQELYTYSLNASELTINDVQIECDYTKCTATISESFSNISGKSKHSTTNSNNEAISVLYNGIKFNLKKVSKPPYVYWNYNFESDYNNLIGTYDYEHMPSGTGLYGVYKSRALLASAVDSAYTGTSPNNYHFADRPFYIRTTMRDGMPYDQYLCMWYNNAEFCIDSSYYDGDKESTLVRLKADMEETFGITLYDGYYESEIAGHSGYYCYIDDWYGSYCDFESFTFGIDVYGRSSAYSRNGGICYVDGWSGSYCSY